MARASVAVDRCWPEDFAFAAELDRRIGGPLVRVLIAYATGRPAHRPAPGP